ncbi:MAG: hypothetical protein HYR56_06080 [Acidobacteria bacterium]|nr:hypothetical protein [Acidobacteriota bacterium]MBI3428437.1 hypothetical protein [Acidobacteriota bacterium]
MLRFNPNILSRVRALFLLLMLVSGWGAVPLALVMPEPVTCGMICCEDAGVCYCTHPHHAAPSSETQISRSSRDCVERCASVAPVSIKFSAARPGSPLLQLLTGGLTPLPESDAPTIQTRLLTCDRAPRAPPVHGSV